MAKVARFYGFSHNEIESMDAVIFSQYSHAIEPIEAKEILVALKISDFPKLKDQERTRLHREFYKKANPLHLSGRKVLTTRELAKKIGVVGG